MVLSLRFTNFVDKYLSYTCMNIHSITFSPTGTSAAIAKAVCNGITDRTRLHVTQHDATFTHTGSATFAPDDILIVAAPVYGGQIAPLFKQRIDHLRGTSTSCILIAVYGNRAFENAIADLASFMSDRGFIVCGAGAFIGEHSYSTAHTPIAHHRPDQHDIAEANRFGDEIAARIAGRSLSPVDISLLKDQPAPQQSITAFRNFVMSYTKRQTENPTPQLPALDIDLCDDCGTCYDACPTDAIQPGQPDVDPARCIKCCACVKTCPTGARSYSSPFAPILSEYFSKPKQPAWIL